MWWSRAKCLLRPRALRFSTLLNIIYLLNSLFLWFFYALLCSLSLPPLRSTFSLFFFINFFSHYVRPYTRKRISSDPKLYECRVWRRVPATEDNKYTCNGTCLARCFLWSCCMWMHDRELEKDGKMENAEFLRQLEFPLFWETPTQLHVKQHLILENMKKN